MSSRSMGLFQRPVNLTEFYTSIWKALFRSDDDSDSEEDSTLLTNSEDISKEKQGEIEPVHTSNTQPAEAAVPPASAYEPWSQDVEANLAKFAEILALETEAEGWTTKVSKPTATIAVKFVRDIQAPSPHGELPIVRASFDFDLDATPDDFYAVMYNVPLRKKWDTESILEYEEFEKPYPDSILYYMVNKVPWPFANREFVERRFIRRSLTGDIEIVFHHTEHEVQFT